MPWSPGRPGRREESEERARVGEARTARAPGTRDPARKPHSGAERERTRRGRGEGEGEGEGGRSGRPRGVMRRRRIARGCRDAERDPGTEPREGESDETDDDQQDLVPPIEDPAPVRVGVRIVRRRKDDSHFSASISIVVTGSDELRRRHVYGRVAAAGGKDLAARGIGRKTRAASVRTSRVPPGRVPGGPVCPGRGHGGPKPPAKSTCPLMTLRALDIRGPGRYPGPDRRRELPLWTRGGREEKGGGGPVRRSSRSSASRSAPRSPRFTIPGTRRPAAPTRESPRPLKPSSRGPGRVPFPTSTTAGRALSVAKRRAASHRFRRDLSAPPSVFPSPGRSPPRTRWLCARVPI